MKYLKLTLKAWPVIAIATIGLCFITQMAAGWFGITLPDQNQVEVVRAHLMHTFESWRHFANAALLLAQILLLAPLLEETIFRLPTRWLRHWGFWLVSAALFSAAHYPDYLYLAQSGNLRWLPLSDAFLALFFFGLAQCWLYRRTGRLWCAMLNHALFNLTNLILLMLVPTA